jgi:hypothetical protein
MAITQTAFQTPGGKVFRSAGRFIKNTSLEDTVASLSKAQPAWFLPVIAKDYNKQVPYVLLPGTVVGVLNARDHTGIAAAHRAQSPNVLVPAFQGTSYKVNYGSWDLATDEYGGTYDLDETGGETIVASTGKSTVTIATVPPIGIVQEPVISRAFFRKHRNLEQQTKINLLVAGKVFRMPAVTSEELLIYPGDLVMVSAGSGDWDPISAPTTSYPGRLAKFDPTDGDCSQIPFIIGRCLERHKIVSQTTPSSGALLMSDIQSGLLDASTLNQDQDYHILKRIQTVPGLYLQGSGTGGVPSDLTFARADASGHYWALDIQIGF